MLKGFVWARVPSVPRRVLRFRPLGGSPWLQSKVRN